MKKFDLCILGAGSGGLTAAAVATQMGARVALIERGKMGGDCLNYGCVPSKALLAAAKAAHGLKTAHAFGLRDVTGQADFFAVKDHVHDAIAQIEPHDSQERFESLGVTVLRGDGKFVDAETVEVNGRSIHARRLLIATGSRPAIPPIPGLQTVPYCTNETLFELREKPEHLAIIGGGPIGVEMAQAHARLGCKVSIIEKDALLTRQDQELVDLLRPLLIAEGITLHEKTGIEEIEKTAGGIILHLTNGKIIEASHLLVAAGRKPNVENLGLDAAGVSLENGFIKTDAGMRTTNKNIFAVGDVTGGSQFTHTAGHQAGVVVMRALLRLPARAKRDGFPNVVFTDPELAQAGLTEKEARARYGADVRALSFDLADNDRARAERRTDGQIKVITGRRGKILGASILAANAGEHIQIWSLALSQKMKIGAMAGYIAPYPTAGEISKRAAGEYFKPVLYSGAIKKLVSFLRLFG